MKRLFCTFALCVATVDCSDVADDARVYFRPYEMRQLVFDLDLRISGGPFRAEPVIVSAILMNQRRGAWPVTIAP